MNLELPPGRHVELPGRGTTFVRELEGPPGAPVLLLLHGWTASSDLNWFGTYDALGQAHRVVALDNRGHGRGIRSAKWFRLDDCADDAIALLDVLGIERATVVGYSMGGALAQLVWLRHRERVDALVLCATCRSFAQTPLERRRLGVLGAFALGSRAVPKQLARDTIQRVMRARSSAAPLTDWAIDELRRNDWTKVLEAGRALSRFDSRTWIGGVDVPTAVVAPQQDQLVPPRRQMALARAIRGATLHPLQGDHAVCSTDPERFVPVLLAACDSVTARTG